jgi:UDP-glucose 4-epimerase
VNAGRTGNPRIEPGIRRHEDSCYRRADSSDHTVDALTGRGDEVVCNDDLSSGKLENLESGMAAGARLVEGDIRDTAFIESTLEAERPSTVFHLAAQSEVRRSIEQPTLDATVNVVGSVNLID